MSITLQNLRRVIAERTDQPYVQRFGAVNGTATDGSTTTLVDSGRLTQGDAQYWEGQWIYFPATQELRVIDSYTPSTYTLTWLEAIASNVSNGDVYEIWSTFSPTSVHRAVNNVIQQAWPDFFIQQRDEIVITSEDGEEYNLSNLLTYTPRWVAKVEIEYIADTLGPSTVDSADSDSITDSDVTFTSGTHDDGGWEVRIYQGTSKGDIRTISSVDSTTTITVSSAFSSTPDTTSKYLVVDVYNDMHNWVPILAWMVDKPYFPTRLKVGEHPYGFEGYTLRVWYEAEHSSVSAEADSITLPQSWLENAVLAELYMMMLSRAPASEMRNWEAMYRAATELSNNLRQSQRQNHYPGAWKNQEAVIGSLPTEYPFVRR